MKQVLGSPEELAQDGRGVKRAARNTRELLCCLAARNRALCAFWREENGQEMVEYTLLVAFFALAGVGVLSGIRTEIAGIWQAISASYATAAS